MPADQVRTYQFTRKSCGQVKLLEVLRHQCDKLGKVDAAGALSLVLELGSPEESEHLNHFHQKCIDLHNAWEKTSFGEGRKWSCTPGKEKTKYQKALLDR